MSTAPVDLVVVGGGLAGLAAAVRSSELGLNVIVLEAGAEDRYLCNSRIAMGFFNVAFRDIGQSEEELRRGINAVTLNTADPELVETFVQNVGRALNWLRSLGIRVIPGNWRPGMAAMLTPPAAIGAGLRWPGRGPDQMLRRLEALLIANGGRLIRAARARRLIMCADQCCGVIADTAKGRVEFLAEAVLIADGGFQNSAELIREFITERSDRVLMRNAGTAVGDGMRMALEVGAATIETNNFYGHVQSADALHNRRLWPYPTLDHLISAGILVNAEGKRFVDEGLGGVYVANVMARQTDPLGAVVIFDRYIWNGRARDFPLPANPLLAMCGAKVYRGETLHDLALAANLPINSLSDTIAEYNASVLAERTQLLSPERSYHLHKPIQIVNSPFFATQAVAGVTYTMGGIAIDGKARVKHQAGGVIRNLFAAGSTTGGHEGGPSVGYTGGLSKALTFGWCAAHAIAKHHAPNNRKSN